jgi:GT2 family glycosyltransferase
MNVNYPLVSLITVNYNGLIYTRAFLKSLEKVTYPNYEVWVVDNASSESIAPLQQEFPQVKFILSKENLGFAGGNNLAIQEANGKYYFLLNNDTEPEPHFLEPIVQLMESNPNIGVASSKLKYFNQPDTLQFAGSKGINMYTGRGFSIGYMDKDKEQYHQNYRSELAHGAAMLISKAALEKIGLMAELYFLYYEETDFCERVKRAGFEIWYCGGSVVLHKESMSVGKESALKTYYLTRNRLIYTRRNAKGFQKLAALLFFFIFSFPKGIFKYLIRKDFILLRAFVKGVSWNFTHFNIHHNTGLIMK